MKAVILAGGPGKHMEPLTEGFPKPLLRVAGVPLIEYAIRGLESAGATEYIVVVSDKHVAEYVEERLSLKSTIVEQSRQEIEGALADAAEYVSPGEHFILAFSDIVAPPEMYRQLVSTYSTSGATAALTVVPVVDAETYGVARINFSLGKITGVVEKPPPRRSPSSLALGGAYVLPYRVAEAVMNGLSLPEALTDEARRGKVVPSLWNGDWVDVGYPWDIISANYVALRWLRESKISANAKVASTAVLEGPVVVEEGAEIDHYAVIKGPVYIGPNAFIGMSSFVREYSSIEEESVVGAYSEVKRSSLQPQASTGSYVLLVDSVLGPNAVIEPRVTVMSRLGDELHIARQPPLQGIVRKYRKLGIFVAPNARVSASMTLGPGMLVHGDGRLVNVLKC